MSLKTRKINRIGILTGGGDCPGLNAVIRAVTKTAIFDYGLEVFGIEDGFEGLIKKRGRFLSSENASGIINVGGTILGTSNRADPFRVPVTRNHKVVFEDHSQKSLRHFREWKLDALVAIGGDGTLSIANRLASLGINIIGIPKTIDNDLSGTDSTFGFDTAVQIATDAIDRLHTTAASHHRVMVLEVMGRNAGWIALYAGVAGGADVILIPEFPFRSDVICDAVKQRARKGKRFSIVTVSEGAYEFGKSPVIKKVDKKNPYPEKLGGIGERITECIEEKTGLEARVAVLGHIQRGGSPTAVDRNLGTLFGMYAVKFLMDGREAHMVCLRGQAIESIPIGKAVNRLKRVPSDFPLVQSAISVGTSFGY
ncbi:MAG: ATP-dependent 6-phosphofructokinase [Candidatus Omnitrophica bacterium]|nr:ATP-dependent 6-phosphofructokinase [Candidatus Omnitrophota bacterium]